MRELPSPDDESSCDPATAPDASVERRREDAGGNATEVEYKRPPEAVRAPRRAAAASLDISPATRRRRSGGVGRWVSGERCEWTPDGFH